MLLLSIRSTLCTFHIPLGCCELWIVLSRWQTYAHIEIHSNEALVVVGCVMRSPRSPYVIACRCISFIRFAFIYISKLEYERMASHQINEHFTRTCSRSHTFIWRISVWDAFSARHCQPSGDVRCFHKKKTKQIHSAFRKVNLSELTYLMESTSNERRRKIIIIESK